jgi:hypothetical protein
VLRKGVPTTRTRQPPGPDGPPPEPRPHQRRPTTRALRGPPKAPPAESLKPPRGPVRRGTAPARPGRCLALAPGPTPSVPFFSARLHLWRCMAASNGQFAGKEAACRAPRRFVSSTHLGQRLGLTHGSCEPGRIDLTPPDYAQRGIRPRTPGRKVSPSPYHQLKGERMAALLSDEETTSPSRASPAGAWPGGTRRVDRDSERARSTRSLRRCKAARAVRLSVRRG